MDFFRSPKMITLDELTRVSTLDIAEINQTLDPLIV